MYSIFIYNTLIHWNNILYKYIYIFLLIYKEKQQITTKEKLPK